MNAVIPHIAVLMSTYNGSRFVIEQVESILEQENVRVSLIVRDDGSSDDTVGLLRPYAARGSLTLWEESNLGVSGSFFRLLENSGDDFDFYAFADQDDVWKRDKLSRACAKLQHESSIKPAMYYSRLEFVNEQLAHLGYSIIPTTRGFHNALVQNQATGCTVVLNKAGRELICTHIPAWTLMHDWWCYLVVSAFGSVVYDEYPGIYYRKHGNNVTPATPNFLLELYARTRRFLGENDIPEKVTDQARLFYTAFGEQLKPEFRTLVEGLLSVRKQSFWGRLRYAATMPVKRNTPFDNLIMRVLIVIGRF